MAPEQVKGCPPIAVRTSSASGWCYTKCWPASGAFSGGSSIEVMSAILKDEPPGLPESVGPGLKRSSSIVWRRTLTGASNRARSRICIASAAIEWDTSRACVGIAIAKLESCGGRYRDRGNFDRGVAVSGAGPPAAFLDGHHAGRA